MRSRVFVINPPRSVLARMLWLAGAIALVGALLFFSTIIVLAGAVLFGLAWLVRKVIRPHRMPTAQSDHAAQVIEGEFVVVEPGQRPLP